MITDIAIYPNPAQRGGVVTVKASSSFESNEEVLIVVQDVKGSVMYTKLIVTGSEAGFVTGIDIEENLAPGLYMIVGTSNHAIFKQKLIIK